MRVIRTQGVSEQAGRRAKSQINRGCSHHTRSKRRLKTGKMREKSYPNRATSKKPTPKGRRQKNEGAEAASVTPARPPEPSEPLSPRPGTRMLVMPEVTGDPVRQAEDFIDKLKREQRPSPLKEKRGEDSPSKVLPED